MQSATIAAGTDSQEIPTVDSQVQPQQAQLTPFQGYLRGQKTKFDQPWERQTELATEILSDQDFCSDIGLTNNDENKNLIASVLGIFEAHGKYGKKEEHQRNNF